MKYSLSFCIIIINVIMLFSQNEQQTITENKELTLDMAIEIALTNNAAIQSALKQKEQANLNVNTAFDINKTNLVYSYDANNIAENGFPITVYQISQSFNFPTAYFAQKNINKVEVSINEHQYELEVRKLKKEVSKNYYSVLYWQNIEAKQRELDSLISYFYNAVKIRFDLGETNYLEVVLAETKKSEIELQLKQTQQEIQRAYSTLNRWLQLENTNLTIQNQLFVKVEKIDDPIEQHPSVLIYKESSNKAEKTASLQKQRLLPDFNLAYFQGTNSKPDNKVYTGYQVGVSIPLFFGSQTKKIKIAQLEKLRMDLMTQNEEKILENKKHVLNSEIEIQNQYLQYYETVGKKLSKSLLTNAQKSFENGEINFLQLVDYFEKSIKIDLEYLQSLSLYNQKILELNFISN